MSTKRASFANLLGDKAQADTEAAASVPPTIVPMHTIAGNPDNPRDPDDLDLDELKATFREVGQLQPVAVVSRAVFLKHFPRHAKTIGQADWVVLGGNRRLEAARALGWTCLDIRVHDHLGDDEGALDDAVIIENIHRKAIAPLKEAEFLQRMVDRHGSQTQVAKRIGKTQGYVSQRLALLNLAPELQEAVGAGELKVKEARRLASIPDQEQQKSTWETERKAAGHYPVIGAGAGGRAEPRPAVAGPSHYPVIDREDRQAAPEAPRAVPDSAGPDRDSGDESSVGAMPWDNPVRVLALASTHMTPANFELLLKQAAQMANDH
ncbi:MAG: parB [Streptosporangiaceae bacterium]|nr:parB [Streptosporangiaceae bacterium]